MTQPFKLCLDLGELAPNERLNYVLGQVLGVNDFQQEQTYFLHKSRLQNRSLHGYGTVWGLDVTTADTGDALEIQVSAGLAIDTRGREVLVDALQCAPLNVWLGQGSPNDNTVPNRDTLSAPADDDTRRQLYVVLCYDECLTQNQAILGDPCRIGTNSNNVLQPTRIRDDFRLELRSTPPVQNEEDRVRDIGNLLIKISLDPDEAPLTANQRNSLVTRMQRALDYPELIETIPDMVLERTQGREILREVMRYWVTITRPRLDKLHPVIRRIFGKILFDETGTALGGAALTNRINSLTDALDDYLETGTTTEIDALAEGNYSATTFTNLREAILDHWGTNPASCDSPEDPCILLASVVFTLTDTGNVDETLPLIVNNMQRPYLLHTRLLQEMLLNGGLRGPQGEPGADGADGADGTDGTNGTDGADGLPGADGADGAQGPPGPGLDQFLIQPDDMILDPETARRVQALLESGNLNIPQGYPMVIFPTFGSATFSVARPSSVRGVRPPTMFLRLYCTTDFSDNEIEVEWIVRWRWVTGAGPVADFSPFNEDPDIRSEDPNDLGDGVFLFPIGSPEFLDNGLPMTLHGKLGRDPHRLSISMPVELPPDFERGDYLIVQLELRNADANVFLLMSELRWEIER